MAIAALMAASAVGQQAAVRLRGTVQDEGTKNAVSGATVSAVGNVARSAAVTDDDGFFAIDLMVAPGSLVRVRVQKAGFAVFDRQVVASEEIPIKVQLQRVKSQPAGDGAATATVDPVVKQYAKQMGDTDTSVRLNALRFLLETAPSSGVAMSAVIAGALDADWRVRLQAIEGIGRLKPKSRQAVTNLLIGLHDVDERVRTASIYALAAFPGDKRAAEALLKLLGSPPSVDTRVMNSLAEMGVSDDSLARAVFYEATIGNEAAIAVLRKQAPWTKDLTAALLAEFFKSLGGRQTVTQQRLLRLLLDAGQDSARTALYRYLAEADPFHQSRLALCWLEVDHQAKDEILQHGSVANLTSELQKAMQRVDWEFISLPETEHKVYSGDELRMDPSDRLPNKCSWGTPLRASMGILSLDLSPKDDALKIMNYVLTPGSEAYGSRCSDYAAVVPRWIDQSAAKQLIPVLAQNLLCLSGGNNVDTYLASDTLAVIGDESTITLLRQLDESRKISCGDDGPPPYGEALGKTRLNRLIERIRARNAVSH